MERTLLNSSKNSFRYLERNTCITMYMIWTFVYSTDRRQSNTKAKPQVCFGSAQDPVGVRFEKNASVLGLLELDCGGWLYALSVKWIRLYSQRSYSYIICTFYYKHLKYIWRLIWFLQWYYLNLPIQTVKLTEDSFFYTVAKTERTRKAGLWLVWGLISVRMCLVDTVDILQSKIVPKILL